MQRYIMQSHTSFFDVLNLLVLHPIINWNEELPCTSFLSALLLSFVLPKVPVEMVRILHRLFGRVAHTARGALHPAVQGSH